MVPLEVFMKQFDKMRELFALYGDQEKILIQEYAWAEIHGEVTRKSNKNGVTAEHYASLLLKDARTKGWISGLK
jgi:hypothetical protein